MKRVDVEDGLDYWLLEPGDRVCTAPKFEGLEITLEAPDRLEVRSQSFSKYHLTVYPVCSNVIQVGSK